MSSTNSPGANLNERSEPVGRRAGARRNLSGRAINFKAIQYGWPFEFIGFLIAQAM